MLVIDSRDEVGPRLITWGDATALREDEATSLDVARTAAASLARAYLGGRRPGRPGGSRAAATTGAARRRSPPAAPAAAAPRPRRAGGRADGPPPGAAAAVGITDHRALHLLGRRRRGPGARLARGRAPRPGRRHLAPAEPDRGDTTTDDGLPHRRHGARGPVRPATPKRRRLLPLADARARPSRGSAPAWPGCRSVADGHASTRVHGGVHGGVPASEPPADRLARRLSAAADRAATVGAAGARRLVAGLGAAAGPRSARPGLRVAGRARPGGLGRVDRALGGRGGLGPPAWRRRPSSS